MMIYMPFVVSLSNHEYLLLLHRSFDTSAGSVQDVKHSIGFQNPLQETVNDEEERNGQTEHQIERKVRTESPA